MASKIKAYLLMLSHVSYRLDTCQLNVANFNKSLTIKVPLTPVNLFTFVKQYIFFNKSYIFAVISLYTKILFLYAEFERDIKKPLSLCFSQSTISPFLNNFTAAE